MTVLPVDVFWFVTGSLVGTLVGLVAAVRVAGSWHRRVAIALACAHIGGVLGVTLFPLPLGGLEPFRVPYSTVQLVPLGTIDLLLNGSQSARQLGGNLLLLAPMGVLVPIAWRAARPWHRTMAWGLLVSLLIELAQLALNVAGLSYRVVDIDDLLLNVAGVAVGRLLFALGWPIWRAVQGPR